MSYETNDKMVSHPDHYKSGKYEVIDIIDEFTKDLSGTEAVCTANAIKYILRWKKKNGIQDVKKAIWYLQHMVDKEEERLKEDHAEFDEELLKKKLRKIEINSVYGIPKSNDIFTPGAKRNVCSNCKYFDVEHMNLNTGIGLCKFYNVPIHNQTDGECFPFVDCNKPSIDDEPKPHAPQQASTGVYIPEEPFMNKPYDELMKENGILKEDLGRMAEEINGLKVRNTTLRNVISTTRAKLANSHYTKKSIRDWLKPYSGK